MKRIFFPGLLIAVLLAALLAPIGPASAQADAPKMTATAAFGGYFKYGEWLPIWVELQNQGGDLDGEVRVSISGSAGTMVFSVPVSLPSGSHKLVPVYVLPNNFSRSLEVQLLKGGKTALKQSVSVRPQPNISYFIGLLTPERGALALLNGLSAPGQERPKILVDLTLADITERAEALRSFDLLVINDTDTAKLTPAQATALEAWVQGGGRLVIGGGPSAQKTLAGLPASLQPAQVDTTIELNQAGLTPLSTFAGSDPITAQGSFVAARSKPGEGSSLLLGDDALPMIVSRPVGMGVVDFIALDLSGVPFNGWPGTTRFWQTLLGGSIAYPQNMPFDMSMRQYRANMLVYPLSNIPSLDLPSIKGLSILLVIYIIFVGPLNYLVLRRFKRLHLAWVTIPVMTVLFTAASFGIGYAMRGNDLVLNKIALVQVKPDGPASLTSYMGLFSPRQTSYDLAIEGEGLLSPMTGYDNNPWMGQGGVQTGGGEMAFVEGTPSRVKGLTVNQWSMQSFMAEGQWSNFGKITADLHIENDTLVGTVKNETTHPLTDTVLFIQTAFVKLGDIAPGQSKPVSLGLSRLQSDRFGSPLSYRLFQENFTNGPMPRAMELKSNIVSSVFENSGMMMKMALSSQAMPGSGIANNGIVFFGWVNDAPPAVSVAGNRISQTTTGLVYTNLDFNLPASGYLTLPAGLVPGSVSKMPVNGGMCGPNGTTSVSMGRGEAELEYLVPASLHDAEINTLKVALWRDTGNQFGMPAVSLYQWENEKWVTIKEPILGTNVVTNAGPYISPQGVIRVRLSSENDNFGCTIVDMGLEATRRAGNGG